MRFFVASLLILLIACSKTEFEPVDETVFGYDYYPLAIGNWWEYELDSVIYDINRQSVIKDSIHAIIRESIVDTFANGVNSTAYKIERTQLNEDSSWTITNVWWVSKNAENVLRNEDNLLFIKLVFPVGEGKSWDGNAFIDARTDIIVRKDVLDDTFAGWDYQYTSVDEIASIQGITYNQVLTVKAGLRQIVNIQWRNTEEKYARGVGLIYKRWEILDSSIDNGTPIEDRADEGFILDQRLTKYFVQ